MRFSCLNYTGIFLFVFLLFSCQNEESLIGNNLVSNGEYNIEHYLGDTPISTSSEREDSVVAIGQKSLLGSYLDPFFGQTNASFCFQIELPNNEIDFNAQNILNIYLNIPYDDFYGDSLVSEENVQFITNRKRQI